MLCNGRTDVGMKREYNQDSFICENFDNGMLLAVVCDGMGGVAGGGIASCLACGSFVDSFTEFAEIFQKKEKITKIDERKIRAALLDAVTDANKKVYEYAKTDPKLSGMGTTLVALLICCDVAFTVNVGDSRMYLIHKDKTEQITHDHSFVQYLVDSGKMTKEQARIAPNRNIITKAVGTADTIEPDLFTTKLLKSSSKREYTAVLCSDGLSNHLTPKEIAKTVKSAPDKKSFRALGTLCEELIDKANSAGGSDNITAVIVTV